MLDHLRAIGVVPADAVDPGPRSAEDELLASFQCYLRDQRGLSETTVRAYAKYARICLRGWWPDGVVAPAALGAADVVAVVRSGVDTMAAPSLRCLVTALRALLRFFHATGLVSHALIQAVPAMASWPGISLPSAVSAAAAERLIASCDNATVAGRRDAAILTALTRLGLRAGEVAALTLDDLDWRAGALRIKGKGGRVDRLPLPADVGEFVLCGCKFEHIGCSGGFPRSEGLPRPPTSATGVVHDWGLDGQLGRIDAGTRELERPGS
jgi:integrase/recombinase XerD